ncbi:MAG: YbhB/YbcL family Raf kinase inhibitor-like protein [Naasia sp.]
MTGHDPYEGLTPLPSFSVTSSDFADGGAFSADQYGADSGGSDISPQLSWSGFPEGTTHFAVTVYDPDAPTGSGFWHWAVFNIPVSTTELPTGAGSPDSDALPDGAVTLPNEMRLPHFVGATPPPGTGTHRYFVAVHALEGPLDIDPESTPAFLGFNLNFQATARAIAVATAEPGGADS